MARKSWGAQGLSAGSVSSGRKVFSVKVCERCGMWKLNYGGSVEKVTIRILRT